MSKGRKRLIGIGAFILLGGLIVLSVYLGDKYRHTNVFFHQVNISHLNQEEGLVIKEQSGTPYLYNKVKDKKVSYFSDGEKVKQDLYYPVYLRDIGTYYILVLSTNQNKDYSHGRFLQNDYERNDHIDRIYLIYKETGKMIRFTEYGLIGRTIDLESFKMAGDIILFNTFVQFETDTSFVSYIVMNEAMNFSPSPYINRPVTKTHYHGDDYSYVKKLVASDSGLFMWNNSYGEVYTSSVGRYKFREDGSEWSGRGRSEFYMNQQYIKLGYFTSHEGSIYFVNNDLELRRLTSEESDEFIDKVDDLKSWTEYLPD